MGTRAPFRDIVAGKIRDVLKNAVSDQEGPKKGNNVLVVDDEALRIINACMPTNDLIAQGFMTVSTVETPEELKEGKRRPKHEDLDALYFLRPTVFNLDRICDDYKQDVEKEDKDIFEKCLPCIFKGIGTVEPEPAWYSDFRMLVLTGPPSKSGGPFDYRTARDWIDTKVSAAAQEYQRIPRFLKHDDGRPECFLQVMAYESNLFSLDMDDSILRIYGAKTQQAIARLTSADGGGDDDDDDGDRKSREVAEKAIDYLHSIAFKLFSAVVALNESPSIRHSKSEAASVVAKEVHSLLASYTRKNRDTFRPWGSEGAGTAGGGRRGQSDDDGDISLTGRSRLSPGEPPEPATLIIVDRMDDVASALLHDVTYSSLVVDLLHHVPTTPLLFDYKAKSAASSSSSQPAASKKYEVLLDESDPVWRSLRYEEMASILDATDELARCMRARETRRKANAGAGEDGKDLEELRRLMNVLASGEKALDGKIAQHYRMRKAIESRFEKRRLHALISLEQALATGVDASGSKISRSDIDAAMRKLLAETAQDKASLREAIKRGERKDAEDEKLKPLLRAVENDQMRLLMLYLLCSKAVDFKTLKEFQRAAELTEDQRHTLTNLSLIKVPLERREKDPRPDAGPFFDDETIKRNRKIAEKTQRLCRYVPKIEDVLSHAIAGTLPEDTYRWERAPTASSRGGAGGGLSGSGGGAGGASSAAIAYHGSHGEVVNQYAAKTIEERRAGDGGKGGDAGAGGKGDGKDAGKAAGGTRTKASRFAGQEPGKGGAGGGGAGGGGAGAGGSGSGVTGEPPDLYDKYMEPPKLRAYDGGRVIVFVVGGLSQMEAAAVDRLSKSTNREMIVGTTSLMRANDFVDQLFEADPPFGDEDNNAGGGGGTGFAAVEVDLSGM